MATNAQGDGITLSIDGEDIAEILDFSGPGIKNTEADVTHQGSTMEESIMTMSKWDPMKFDINLNQAANASHVSLRTKTISKATVTASLTLSDGSVWGGSAHIMSFEPKKSIGKQQMASIEIKPTGTWTYSI